jgi:hypothetical protein
VYVSDEQRSPAGCIGGQTGNPISARALRLLDSGGPTPADRKKGTRMTSDGPRKRLLERARTPSWWRRARISSRRSRRLARPDWLSAPALMTARIACKVMAGDANVNDFGRTQYWRGTANAQRLTPIVRPQVFKKFRGLAIKECPFANLPEAKSGRWGAGLTAAKMKDCRWLKPVLVAQIEFLEWTGDNHLRHTKFVALRDDKPADQVRRE